MTGAHTTFDIAGLYGAHSGWLRDWLSRRTHCAHRSADLVQDTFCRLLESQSQTPPRNPRPYLVAVARRLLIDDIRRRIVETAIVEALSLHRLDGDTITPERIAEASQLLDAIAQILDALPEQAKAAFLLRRIDGLEQKDIAERLCISLSTVKRHIALAYARCYTIAYPD